MYFGHHYWGMHLFWWIFWVVGVTALLIFLWPSPPRRARDSAHEILRRRFAAGEITERDYRERLAVLDTDRAPAASHDAHGGASSASAGSAA